MNFFPDRRYSDVDSYAKMYFSLFTNAAASVDGGAMEAAVQLLAKGSAAGHMIFSCGNGGSAAISNHLVCDCMKGVRTNSTLRPRVQSLSATVETITAIGNDIGYGDIFSFQLESLARSGDILIAISSSGRSPNIINALKKAREMGVSTIAMTGFDGGDAARLADVSLHVASQNYGVVEDVHQSLMHILAQYLRHSHLEEGVVLGQIKF